jgi:hypothetical protein
MFGFLCCPLTKFPLHFADIHRYIPLFVSYLCVGSFRKLRAFAVGVFFYSSYPSCGRLSRPLTTMPYPTLPCGIGVSLGSPLPTVHPPYHPQGSLPCSACRTRTECRRWRVLNAPSTLCGSPVFARGKVRFTRAASFLPLGLRALATTPPVMLGFHVPLADISGKVCPGQASPKGFITLLVNHHSIPQPSTTSWILAFSSWCLLGSCCSPHAMVHEA